MINIGQYNSLRIARFSAHGAYLTDGETEVLLPQKYLKEEMEVGEDLNVFVYNDSQDRPVAVTTKPLAQVDQFAYLYVKALTKVGAFVDWGLEKDLLVPFKEQRFPLQEDRAYIFRLCLDHRSNRVIATTKLFPFFDRDVSELKEGQEVSMLVYEKADLGFLAIIDDRYLGLIYDNEVFEPLAVGDKRKGFIKKIRNDGKIDLALQKQGYEAVEDSKDIIIDELIKAGGELPYHDKSDSEEIKKVFRMSKKNFKKVVGSLYKAGLIELKENGIKLKIK
ncbi:CvfB family protein [Aureibacter tunicatorum]|uniref:GntR family transcriptional regulator n=1 Tax=Aureibacter tunicatorum TaxID=866807 RepID=A0AAE4BQW9_9BACT|nr:S1-like domain-containing RNA-binding protein [Aureibacter tunicatorum]MDR6239619.1 hypothetical protein [Aureibacter tunicatorum]BDD04096.1 GntR family transcriptional regulator [Aureibacter tunicatorum]